MSEADREQTPDLQGEPWYVDQLMATSLAFADPQPGDGFHELWAAWMFVLAVQPEGGVDVLVADAKASLPDGGVLVRFGSADDFRRAYTDESGLGYRMQLVDRLGPESVPGWLEHHLTREERPWAQLAFGQHLVEARP